MRIRVLEEIPEDPNLCEAWNTLVMGMENREVFFTYQWALAACHAFRDHLSPLVLLVYDSDVLIGVAALAKDRKAPRSAFFLTSTTADYCDVVSTPGKRKIVLQILLEEIKKLGLSDLVLANVPANSTTFLELADVAKSGRFHVVSRTAYNCGVVQLEGKEQRDLLVQSVAKKTREKRALKKLSSLGTIGVAHITDPEQISASVESIVSAQIWRFLASNRLSPLLQPQRRRFLRHLSDLLAHSGWLKISQLEVDGQPVAWNYGFRFGGSWFWYLPTFHLQYEQVSPGSCLLRLLLEEGARDTSVRWFDLGLGAEQYKERFANHSRQTKYIHLSLSFRRHAVSLLRQSVTTVATRFPRLSGQVRDARAFYQAAQARIHEGGMTGTARQAVHRIVRFFASEDEMLFFEAPISGMSGREIKLESLTQEHLVEALILNAGDVKTVSYLMRCARRLKQPDASGFVLRSDSGKPVHFLWIARYDGFHLAEINWTLESSSTGAALIFDCWTPTAERGHNHYVTAIWGAVAQLHRNNRAAWIFCAATNALSLRGIVKAGFAYRFSLKRLLRFGHSVVTRNDAIPAIPSRKASNTTKQFDRKAAS